MISPIGLDTALSVVLRTILIFFFTFILMRLRGKRQLAQLTLFDLVIIISLGSAVGDVMIYSDSIAPMLNSMIAIATVIVLIMLLENIMVKGPKSLVTIMEGSASILIRDGKLDRNALRKVKLSEGELRSMLREKNIKYFSDVRVARMEPDGQLSVERKKPGKK